MYASSPPKKDGYVYKRRKLHRNSVALLSEQNVQERNRESGGHISAISSEYHLSTPQKDDVGRAPVVFADGWARNLSNNGNPYISAHPHPQKHVVVLALPVFGIADLESAKTAVTNVWSSMNDSFSSSRSKTERGSALIKLELEDAGECSSSDGMVVKPSGEIASPKDLCIAVLRSHGLLGGVWSTSACTSVEVLGRSDDAKFSQSCKICKLLGNPLKMLICDLCEEVFHLSCCKPKVKKVPVDEWYCQTCFRKRPKPSVETNPGKSYNNIKGEGHRKRMLQGEFGPIESILKDTQPYTSRVRIGADFQAEIPDWSGPISDDYNFLGEASELDPAECVSLHGWQYSNSSRPSSIGNWIQCREVIYSDIDESDEGVICGKWRRAPLFVSQTEDWDCSCAVLWDPVHADCAVPQELETAEVLRHLKYVQLLKPRLAIGNQRPSQTKSYGCEQLWKG